MSRPVHIAALGHCSARGCSAAAAAQAVLRGDTGCGQRAVLGDRHPYFELPCTQNDWLTRAERAVVAVGRPLQTAAGKNWADIPLFLASSSFQIGDVEHATRQIGELRLPPAAQFAQRVAGWLGLKQPPWCFSTACTSSLAALDAASSLIRAGALERAVVLGLELRNDTSLAGFGGLKLLSRTVCRPMDRNRDGLVLGEAAAGILLTAGEGPWRVSACRLGLDTHSPTGPDPDGETILEVMQSALADAKLAPDTIQLVKLQAAGSPTTDMAEATALKRLFGAAIPPLLSLKPCLGHTLGASGMAELTALLPCLDAGLVPATPGFAEADPELGLVPTTERCPMEAHRILFNLVGFGGSIAALVLENAAP